MKAQNQAYTIECKELAVKRIKNDQSASTVRKELALSDQTVPTESRRRQKASSVALTGLKTPVIDQNYFNIINTLQCGSQFFK